MPISTYTFCTYFTAFDSISGRASGPTYDALDFVKATKGKASFASHRYATVPVCGEKRRLDSTNVAKAVGWFGEIVAGWLANVPRPRPLLLVPVPSSKATSPDLIRGSAPFRIATAIAACLGNAEVEVLLWNEREVPSAHEEGGSRDPNVIFANLRGVASAKRGVDVILVDDVYTLGGHIQAAEAKLRQLGMNVWFGLAVGRTVHAEEANPFNLMVASNEKINPMPTK
jgi:hypothetical protein